MLSFVFQFLTGTICNFPKGKNCYSEVLAKKKKKKKSAILYKICALTGCSKIYLRFVINKSDS